MTVALHQPSGAPLSYFRLQARAGRPVSAGTLELRNLRSRRITVLLDPIRAVTATTLGSAYDMRGRSTPGPASWTRLARRRVVLAPHGRANVAVTVVPAGARPGDYLSGIGLQAVEPPQTTKVRANVAVSSTERYAIGVEVRVPGRRRPSIKLTGASVKRDPAGIAFSVFGHNAGNVILQNVHGSVLITRGRRVVARTPIGPGTFVTGTSIAYPVPTPREQPLQGTVYRVRAVMRYPGGVARLDTGARFGHAAAVRQQSFGGPKAPGAGSGFPVPVLVAIGAIALAALAVTRPWRLRPTRRSPLPTLGRALAGARDRDEPLSVILVRATSNGAGSRHLASVLRGRLRSTDRLCRLDGSGFLVVASDTDAETAHVLAADLRRHLDRATGGCNGAAVEAHVAGPGVTAAEMLERITDSDKGASAAAPQS